MSDLRGHCSIPLPPDAEVKAAREEKIRQSWIGVMEARLVREKLAECWRTEGVNHYEVSPAPGSAWERRARRGRER